MKIRLTHLIIVLLLPFALLANESEQAKMMEDMMLKMKNQVLTAYSGMLPLMQEAKTCLSSANSKSQAQQCSTEFAKKYQKFLQSSGLEEFMEDDDLEEDFDFDDVIWSDSTKQEILRDLEQSIRDIKKHRDCLKTYDSADGLQKCHQIMR